jgi:hypothetical protein
MVLFLIGNSPVRFTGFPASFVAAMGYLLCLRVE